MKTQSRLINTFSSEAMKQMHTFCAEGIILGPQKVVHIIYNFIKRGI